MAVVPIGEKNHSVRKARIEFGESEHDLVFNERKMAASTAIEKHR